MTNYHLANFLFNHTIFLFLCVWESFVYYYSELRLQFQAIVYSTYSDARWTAKTQYVSLCMDYCVHSCDLTKLHRYGPLVVCTITWAPRLSAWFVHDEDQGLISATFISYIQVYFAYRRKYFWCMVLWLMVQLNKTKCLILSSFFLSIARALPIN